MPANRDLAGASVELPRHRGLRDAPARAASARSASASPSTLLDCPPSLGPVTVNALAAADRVIVPVQAEYLALEGLVQFLDTLATDPPRAQPGAGSVRDLLITMHDERTRLAQDVERELREHFPELVFETVDPAQRPRRRGAELRPAGDRARARLARRPIAYRALAEELAGPWLAAANAGIGRGLAAILPEADATSDAGELRELPVELIKPNPSQPRDQLRRRGARRPRRLDRGQRRRPAAARPPAPRRQLRADRRRAPLARRPAGRAREGAGDRPRPRTRPSACRWR